MGGDEGQAIGRQAVQAERMSRCPGYVCFPAVEALAGFNVGSHSANWRYAESCSCVVLGWGTNARSALGTSLPGVQRLELCSMAGSPAAAMESLLVQ